MQCFILLPHLVDGEVSSQPVELPWLDVDQSQGVGRLERPRPPGCQSPHHQGNYFLKDIVYGYCKLFSGLSFIIQHVIKKHSDNGSLFYFINGNVMLANPSLHIFPGYIDYSLTNLLYKNPSTFFICFLHKIKIQNATQTEAKFYDLLSWLQNYWHLPMLPDIH